MSLRLIRESFGPRVELLAWGEGGPASADEQDEIARLALSRASGTDVVLVAVEAARDVERPPADLGPIGTARGLGSEHVGIRFELLAGRGRGRVFAVTSGGLEAARELARRLSERGSRVEIDRHVAFLATTTAHGLAAVDERGELGGRRRGRLDELDAGALLPADQDSRRAFRHAIAIGGEPSLEPAAIAGSACFGALVRGRESFELVLRAGGRPLARSHLVLVRRGAGADRGALLRVELDDEDLGPWRLGERGAIDTFAVPWDLLEGRERVRVAVTPDEGREVASILWRFAVEPELDGIGLTELEPAAIAGRVAPRDRDFDGELLAAGGRAFLHGLALATQDGAATLRWSLPAGYGRVRLAAALARDREPGRSVPFEILLDERCVATLELRDAGPEAATIPLGPARSLTMRARASPGEVVLVLDPALLR